MNLRKQAGLSAAQIFLHSALLVLCVRVGARGACSSASQDQPQFVQSSCSFQICRVPPFPSPEPAPKLNQYYTTLEIMVRGAFIVIEGLDRSGKTTQTELLTERLTTKNGVSIERRKFPGE